MRLLSALILALTTSSIHAQTTWYVDDDGKDNAKAQFTDIQSAIDAASDGDEIVVAPGTYIRGDGSAVVNMLGKELTLRSSDGPDITIIDGENLHLCILFENNENDTTIFNGFTIKNGFNSNPGGGIYIFKSSPIIMNCIISNNYAPSGGGIAVIGNRFYNGTELESPFTLNPTINNCIIRNNASSFGGGIFCQLGELNLESCEIYDNASTNKGGGLFIGASTLDITNSTILNNSSASGAGISFTEQSDGSTFNSSIMGNTTTSEWGRGGGIEIEFNSSPAFSDCNVENNVSNGDGGGISIWSYLEFEKCNPVFSSCYIANNTSSGKGGGIDITLSEGSFINCSIEDNLSSEKSPAIHLTNQCSTRFTSCLIQENYSKYSPGAGIYAEEKSSAYLEGTTIINNGTSGYPEDDSDYPGYPDYPYRGYPGYPEYPGYPGNNTGSSINYACWLIESSTLSTKDQCSLDNIIFLNEGIGTNTLDINTSFPTNIESLKFNSNLRSFGSKPSLALPDFQTNINYSSEFNSNPNPAINCAGDFYMLGSLSITADLTNPSNLQPSIGDTIPLINGNLIGSYSSYIFPSSGSNNIGFTVSTANSTSRISSSMLMLEAISLENTQFNPEIVNSFNCPTIEAIPFDLNNDGTDEFLSLSNCNNGGEINIYGYNPFGRSSSFENMIETIKVGSDPTDITVDDIDNDGDLDIAVSNGTDSTISIITNNSDESGPSFEVETIAITDIDSVMTIGILDLNNSGIKDIVAGVDASGTGNSDGYKLLEINKGNSNLISFIPTGFIDLDPSENQTQLVSDTPVDIEIISAEDSPYGVDTFIGITEYGQIGAGYNPFGRNTPTYIPIYKETYANGFGVQSQSSKITVGQLDNINLNTLPDIVVSSTENKRLTIVRLDPLSMLGFEPPTFVPVSEPVYDISILDADNDGDGDILFSIPFSENSYNPFDRNAGSSLKLLTNDFNTTGILNLFNTKEIETDITAGIIISADINGNDSLDILPIDIGFGYNPFDRTCSIDREDSNESSAQLITLGEDMTCEGDTNSDAFVDTLDLLQVINNFGQSTSSGDANGDLIIDVLDLLAVISNFGSNC